jgi:hypothetical protein
MNLTVWSFPPTLRFIFDLLSMACAIMDADWCVHAAPHSQDAFRESEILDSMLAVASWSMEFPNVSG